MCLCIAVPTICGPLILTDRRVSGFSSSLVGAPRELVEDQLAGHVDVGGRMVRVGPSWVIAGGGSAHFASAVLRAVIEAGKAKPPAKEWTLDTTGRWPLEVAEIVRRIAEGFSPEVAAEAADTSFFVALDHGNTRGNVIGIKANGDVYGGWLTVYNSPPNLGEYVRSRLAMSLEKDVATLKDWAAIVRRVAGECALISRLCKTVSPTCEIACGDRFYTGDAKALTKMSDDEIRAAFGDAPGNDAALERVAGLTGSMPVGAQTIGDGSTCTLSNIDAFWNGTNTAYGTSTGGKATLGRLGSGTGTAGRQVTVTFPVAYSTAPYIAITPNHSGSIGNAYTAHLGLVTTTAFDIYMQVAPTTTGDDTLSFTWVVIG